MSRLALSLQKCARVLVSRPGLALALAATLLISAPQIAAADPPESGELPGTLSVGDISIVEGDTQVLVPVTFTGNAPTFEFTITAFTGPGDTATDGADYTGRTTTRTATGLPETINFNVVIKDDAEVEGNETFTVRITGVAGAGAADVTIGDDTATVTITPDGDTDDGGGGGGDGGDGGGGGGGGGGGETGSLVIISPQSKSASFDQFGGFGRVEVSGDLSSWKAVPHDKWIEILQGESGSGDGTVSYIVSSQSSQGEGGHPDRAGSIDIGGETFSISQGGPLLDTPGCGFLQESPPPFRALLPPAYAFLHCHPHAPAAAACTSLLPSRAEPRWRWARGDRGRGSGA